MLNGANFSVKKKKKKWQGSIICNAARNTDSRLLSVFIINVIIPCVWKS